MFLLLWTRFRNLGIAPEMTLTREPLYRYEVMVQIKHVILIIVLQERTVKCKVARRCFDNYTIIILPRTYCIILKNCGCLNYQGVHYTLTIASLKPQRSPLIKAALTATEPISLEILKTNPLTSSCLQRIKIQIDTLEETQLDGLSTPNPPLCLRSSIK